MENRNGLKTEVTYQTATIHNIRCHQLQEIIFFWNGFKMQFVEYGILIFLLLESLPSITFQAAIWDDNCFNYFLLFLKLIRITRIPRHLTFINTYTLTFSDF